MYTPDGTPHMKNDDAESVFGMLLPRIGKAVSEAGYTVPTPIQEQSIPPLLNGRDILGCAQTGTGKTAAFMLPILNYLVQADKRPIPRKPQVLILAPTRELAAQIGDSVLKYGKHTRVSRTVIFGGVGQQPQVKALRKGVNIVAATPGRLLDLMEQRHLDVSGVEIFVLDEADRMLDMGFLPDIKRIIAKLPSRRQSLFFSATMEGPIVELASTLVYKPVRVTIDPGKPAVERIVQKVMFVDREDKDHALIKLMGSKHLHRVLIFTQMKHVANRVEGKLTKAGINCASIHGNKSQTARTLAMKSFKSGKIDALVATDIAARGIDVEGISHVINYDMPEEAETYVHRIGRTARAGADGDAISFCSARERDYLRAVERLIHAEIPRDLTHDKHSHVAMNATGSEARPLPRGSGRGGQSRKKSAGNRPGGKRPRARTSSGKPTAPGKRKRADQSKPKKSWHSQRNRATR
jgi:ATP-dependent RNA helicase RhlE